jgi:hypothetical protein
MMSTRPLDLRGGAVRFVSSELPGGRPALFKLANGLLKSLTLDLFDPLCYVDAFLRQY